VVQVVNTLYHVVAAEVFSREKSDQTFTVYRGDHHVARRWLTAHSIT
jgi:hypothetical protein